MVDVSIVNETSPEANWHRQADGQTNLGIGRHVPPNMGTGRKNGNEIDWDFFLYDPFENFELKPKKIMKIE